MQGGKYNLLCTDSLEQNWDNLITLQALEMWLFATMTHSMPCSTRTGMARSVNTISAGKKPASKHHVPYTFKASSQWDYIQYMW